MQHLDNAQCTKTKLSGEKEVCFRYTRGTTAGAAIKMHYLKYYRNQYWNIHLILYLTLNRKY